MKSVDVHLAQGEVETIQRELEVLHYLKSDSLAFVRNTGQDDTHHSTFRDGLTHAFEIIHYCDRLEPNTSRSSPRLPFVLELASFLISARWRSAELFSYLTSSVRQVSCPFALFPCLDSKLDARLLVCHVVVKNKMLNIAAFV